MIKYLKIRMYSFITNYNNTYDYKIRNKKNSGRKIRCTL